MGELARQFAKLPKTKRNSPLRIQRKKSSQPIKSPADRILFLQRTIGNQAVQRVIKSGTLQAKLKIGQPGDIYEQEADRVADAVMQMPEPGVQQQVEPEEEEEEEELQTKTTSGNIPEVQPNIESHIHSLKGGGQPLSEKDRAFFEPRFGRDFSQVRVHADAKAAETAKAMNARAFTVGQDVVFGARQYSPGTSQGQRLLAHELTHSIQQEGSNDQKERPSSRTENYPNPITRHAPAAVFREQRVPVDPEIASLPANRYVDAFREAYYDLSYRAEGGNLSTWLTVEYSDGTLIDINIYDFLQVRLSPLGVSNSMRQGYVGIGNRIFPRQLTPKTTPRLWASRNAAIEVMEQYNLEFMMTAMPAVFFIISLVGGVSSPRATARPSSRPRIRPRRTGGGRGRQTPRSTPAQTPAAAQGPRQSVGYTRHARGAAELGGFRSGITHQEIAGLNRQFGGATTITGHPSSALAAAARQQGFWRKTAAIVREIAGRHMFNDANKRTANAVVNELRRRNNVFTGVEGAQLRRVINDVATGSLRTIEEIARALRGF